MSFDSLSPEVVMKIFSHQLGVRTKIRLERVSKRFRDCIRNVESWKNNTELVISIRSSIEEVRAFLSHTPVVTKLSVLYCGNVDILACLWAFSDKLTVTDFTYGPLSYDTRQCPKNQQIVACCLGKFSETLTSATLRCCQTYSCDTLKVFASVLPTCRNLKHLHLVDVNDDEGRRVAPAQPFYILNSLQNMSLCSIHLQDFAARPRGISGQRLAAVCNTSKNHSLSSLTIEDEGEGEGNLPDFALGDFCEALEPAASLAIKTLELKLLDCTWVQILPTLPVLMPNLSHVVIEESMDDGSSYDDAVKKARALGSFMHACLPRENNIKLDLEFFCSKKFSNRFWDAVDLVEIAHSGAKQRNENLYSWNRTLSNGIATINISVVYAQS